MEALKLSNDRAKLHQMFGKKLYADKYSFLCELAQNAVDSHRMSGQTEPVKVGIKLVKQSDQDYICFVRDYGISFNDKEDFINKVCTILESGKSENKTNDESCPMGMHGIGSISPSAYQNEWKYTVYKDNTMFTCLFKEIEGKGLVYDISEYSHCEEVDGVLVEVAVKNGDLAHLTRAILDKLCYFKDILFEFDEEIIRSNPGLLTINSYFQIFQADDFQMSTLCPTKEMHICLDQYYYPIRWQNLNIEPIKLGIGLKFGLNDGLQADITRENLCFSPEYAEIVMNKIKKVANWFVDKYNSGIKDEYESIVEVSEALRPEKVVTLEFDGDKSIGLIINDLARYSDNGFKHIEFKDVSDDVLERFLKGTSAGFDLFKSVARISNGRKRAEEFTGRAFNNNYYKKENLIYTDKKISTKMINYLKTKSEDTYIINRIPKIPFKAKTPKMSYWNLMSLGTLTSHVKDTYKQLGINIWREKIKMFQRLWDIAEKEFFTNLDDVAIPSHLVLKERKKPIKRPEDKVGIKFGVQAGNARKWSCHFFDKTVEIDELHRLNKFHVYGTESMREELDVINRLSKSAKKSNIQVCIITEREQKKLPKLHNFMEVSEFLKGKHRVFRKMLTSYIISRDILIKFDKIFKSVDLIGKELSTKFAEDMKELQDYYKAHGGVNYVPLELVKELVSMTHEYKLYDWDVWGKAKAVEEYIPRFDFVEFFDGIVKNRPADCEYKAKALAAMRDIARQRKIRMNWEKYELDKLKEKS